MHRPLAACGALFLAAGVAAQQPTFRASTRLVEVSVVVEDGSGRPVEGLSRSDFTVYEDGVEVSIEIFAPPPARGNTAVPAASASRLHTVATPREPLTRGDFSNRLGEAVPTNSAPRCCAMAYASRAPSPPAPASIVCTSSSATRRPGQPDR